MIDWNKYKLITYWHDRENAVMLKFYDKEDKKVVFKKVRCNNYFFIDKINLDNAKQALLNFNIVNSFTTQKINVYFTFQEEGKFIKISYNPCVNIWLKYVIDKIIETLDYNNIKHYTTDLWPGDNYVIDNNFEISDNYKILFYDCETDDRVGGVMIGEHRILSICAVNERGEEFIFCDDDEYKILNDFNNLLKDYDILIGWNSNHFDYPYIKARVKLHNIKFFQKSIIHIDLMKVFMSAFAVKTRIGQKNITGFSLDNIAKEFINDSKLVIEEGGEGYGGRIWNLFMSNRRQLIKYNLQDCKLLKRLDDEFNLLKNEIYIAKIAKSPLSKTRSVSGIIDFLMIKEGRKRGVHFGINNFDTEKQKKSGGFVVEPIVGIHDNTHIYDFSSLYPNLFRVTNASIDTLLNEKTGDCITTLNNTHFSKDRGLFPEVLDKLTIERLEYKRMQKELEKAGKKDDALVLEFKQTAIKVVILSIYGISGAHFSRFFNVNVSNAITETGQHMLKTVVSKLNALSFTVISGDTDSIMFNVPKHKCKEEAEMIINKTIDMLVKSMNTPYKNTLQMEFEKKFSTFIVLAKKKYVGRCIEKDGKECDELYYKGIELVKGSEIKLTKKLLREIIMMILFDNNMIIDKYKKIILDYRKQIVNKEIKDVDEIIITKKVGGMPDSYTTIPSHVELALQRKEKGEFFYTSMKVPFIVVSENPLKIIHRDDFDGEYDKKYYWSKQIYPPTLRLLQIVFPHIDWSIYSEATNDIQKTLT